MPNVAITTDIIVGFPGETEKEFKETCDFVRKIGFAKLHVFRFSPRVGTRAASMSDQIPETIKIKRSNKLVKIGGQLRTSYTKRFLGTEMEVLFEEEKSGFWYGLTSNYIRIKHKSNQDLHNKIVKIKLKKENLA